MDRVEELRQQLKEALELFHHSQQKKWLYLQEIHKTILEILGKYMTETIRLNIQSYFEERNENLHITLKNIDDSLNQASEAHATICSYRSKLIDACNDRIQPTVKVDDGNILLSEVGLSDLENMSSKTEQCVLQISDLQDRYCSLMVDIEDRVIQRIDVLLNDMEAQIKQLDQKRSNEVSSLMDASNEELDKAVQVLQSMEQMKQQMESLFQILKKPNSTF